MLVPVRWFVLCCLVGVVTGNACNADGIGRNLVNGEADGTCRDCQPGEYSSPFQAQLEVWKFCLQCPFNGPSTVKSNLCLAGTETVASVHTTCSDTQARSVDKTSCVSCDSPFYSGMIGLAACRLCPAGTYRTPGVHSCTPCSAGSYAPAGSSSCTPCASGTFSEAGAAECVSATVALPLYPCNSPTIPSALRDGYYSPNWFNKQGATEGVSPVGSMPFFGASMRDLKQGPAFIGYGPTTGQDYALALYENDIMIRGPSSLSCNQKPWRLDSNEQIAFGTGLIIGSGGFVPLPGDEWAWFTHQQSSNLYIMHLPECTETLFPYIYGERWLQRVPVYDGHPVWACATSYDNEGNRASFLCMVRKTDQDKTVVRLTLDMHHVPGVSTTVTKLGSLPTFDTVLPDSMRMTWPVHFHGYGYTKPARMFYRCQTSNWCVRTLGSNAAGPEQVFIDGTADTDAHLGMVLGGLGGDGRLVYFLDRVNSVVRAYYDVPTTIAGGSGLTADQQYQLPEHYLGPSYGRYFGGYAFYLPNTSPQPVSAFFLSYVSTVTSFDGSLHEYRRDPCVECSATACVTGEYEISVCDTTANTNRVCSPCSTCSTGQYILENSCSGSQDTTCVDCRVRATCPHGTIQQNTCEICGTGEQLINECDGTAVRSEGSLGPAQCGDCNAVTCGQNEFKGLNCGCEQCSTRSCTPGFYVQTCDGTTATDDSSCAACAKHPAVSNCAVGEYFSGLCATGNDWSDVSACSPCTVTSCPVGYFLVDECDGSSTTETAFCQACPRQQGKYFTGNSACDSAECTILACCPDGSGTVDPLATDPACEAILAGEFSCDAGCQPFISWESTPCDYSTLQQRVCSDCTICNPPAPGTGQYYVSFCMATADAVCGTCNADDPGSCAAGHYWQPCTFNSPGQCVPCSAKDCESHEYNAGCTDGTQDYYCEDCTHPTCGANEYVSSCLPSADRTCVHCGGACAAGTYESTPCSEGQARVCTPCTASCPTGTFIAQDCQVSTANPLPKMCL